MLDKILVLVFVLNMFGIWFLLKDIEPCDCPVPIITQEEFINLARQCKGEGDE